MKFLDRIKFRGRKSIPYERVIFLHIQKTAGTGVSNHIINYLKAEKHMRWGDFAKISKKDLNSYFYISGHFGFDYIADILEGSYAFTFLRDPIERTISEYNFFLQLPVTEARKKVFPHLEMVHQMSFEEFIDSEISNIANRQTRLMNKTIFSAREEKDNNYHESEMLEGAKENLHKFSYIGFKETFKEDFYNILKELNIPLPIRNKVVNKSRNKVDVNSLSQDTLEKLESKVHLDRNLYMYAWNNLRRE